MTLGEAIALLSGLRSFLPQVGLDKYKASVQLGIEALKHRRRLQWYCQHCTMPPLPGETKE